MEFVGICLLVAFVLIGVALLTRGGRNTETAGKDASNSCVDAVARKAAASANDEAREARRRADAAGKGAWYANGVMRSQHDPSGLGGKIMAELESIWGSK